MVTETAFRAYGYPLINVVSFKYLGCKLMAMYDDWPAVVANLRKVRNKWSQMSQILGREEDNVQTSGEFFKVVVQVVPLLGSEMWLVTPALEGRWGVSNTGWPAG